MGALSKLACVLRFVLALTSILPVAGCASPRPWGQEIRVCARLPGFSEDITSWALLPSGTIVTEPWEVALAREHQNPIFVFDPNADPNSVKMLPLPHNDLECPERLLPPPVLPPKEVEPEVEEPEKEAEEPAMAQEAQPQPIPQPSPEKEEARRPRTTVTVKTTVARREARCPHAPGQVRRTRSTGKPCLDAEKSTSVPARPSVRPTHIAQDEGEEEETIEPPRRPDGPLQDWNVREPTVDGLSPERIKECVAALCHARHPNFAPKEKGGTGKAQEPKEGQSWSRGGKPFKQGKPQREEIVRGPGGARKHQPGRGHDGKSAPQKEKKRQKDATKKKQENVERFKAIVEDMKNWSPLERRQRGNPTLEKLLKDLDLKPEDVKDLL